MQSYLEIFQVADSLNSDLQEHVFSRAQQERVQTAATSGIDIRFQN